MADTSLLIHVDQTTPLDREGRTGKELLRRLINHLEGLLIGAARGSSVKVWADGTDPVAASGTFTLDTVIATDAVTVGTETFTAVASGATANQFNVGADDDETAENLAAAINAHDDLAGVVSASASGAVVTVTCLIPGTIGNNIILSDADTTITTVAMSGGAGGDVAPITITL